MKELNENNQSLQEFLGVDVEFENDFIEKNSTLSIADYNIKKTNGIYITQEYKNELKKSANKTINIIKRDLVYKKDGSLDEKYYSTNVEVILNNIDIIKDNVFYDTFSNTVQYKSMEIPGPVSIKKISDYDEENYVRFDHSKVTSDVVLGIKLYLETYFKLVATSASVAEKLISETIYNIALQNKQNLVKDSVKNLDGLWDGKKRLETFFSDIIDVADNDLNRRISKTFFKSLIKIIEHPGYNIPFQLDLAGGQGFGKSTLVKKIGEIPTIEDKGLRQSLSMQVSDNVASDVFKQKVRDLVLVIDDEGQLMANSSIQAYKNMLTSENFSLQPKYKNSKEVIPKHFLVVRTTNEINLYFDKTGNRRFFYLVAGETSKSKEETANKVWDFTENGDDYLLQVYAEAYQDLRNDEKISMNYFSKQLSILAKDFEDKIKDKTESSTDEDNITNFIDMPIPLNFNDFSDEEKREYTIKYRNQMNPNVVKIANEVIKGNKYNNNSRFTYQKEITFQGIQMLVIDSNKIEKALKTKIDMSMGNDSRFKYSKSLGTKRTLRGWKRIDGKENETFKVWISGEKIEDSVLTKDFLNSQEYSEKEDTDYTDYVVKDGDKNKEHQELDHLAIKNKFTDEELELFKNKYENIIKFIKEKEDKELETHFINLGK